MDKVSRLEPGQFERLVIDLLLRMGYGGLSNESAEHLGKSGDEGVDGLKKQDILGLEKVYIQDKRWQGTVGREEIQKFVGALHGKGAKKGVFITFSSFSAGAKKYAQDLKALNLILIDGEDLVTFMIKYNLGVQIKDVIEIKELDDDNFERL